MACFHPITAYRSLTEKTENGKAKIYFSAKEIKTPYEEISLPCSRCIGCRIEKSREWAVRCVHEASLHEWNCFITLTFNEENLHPDKSLDKTDFQLFMKRLRKRFSGDRIRYFHCGEYGEQLERPHHHACLFGIDFYDKEKLFKREGVQLYHSQILEDIWGKGLCVLGDVTFQSAAYVARYIIKKLNGEKAAERYVRNLDKETGECTYLQPEYITMSRRPGIGKEWFNKFGKTDLFPKDYLTINGKRFKVPKYYQNQYELLDAEMIDKVKRKRKEQICRKKEEFTLSRLKTRKKVLLAKTKNLKRSYEK